MEVYRAEVYHHPEVEAMEARPVEVSRNLIVAVKEAKMQQAAFGVFGVSNEVIGKGFQTFVH